MRLSILMFALLFVLGTICGTHEDLYPDDTATPCNEANEGYEIDDRNSGGPLMLPGANCLQCHEYMDAVGTAFMNANGDEPLEGAIIRLTDAEGAIVESTTNEAGNFSFGDMGGHTLVFPVTAEVEVDGAIAAMIEPVETGSCNSCHSCDGEAGAKLHGP